MSDEFEQYKVKASAQNQGNTDDFQQYIVGKPEGFFNKLPKNIQAGLMGAARHMAQPIIDLQGQAENLVNPLREKLSGLPGYQPAPEIPSSQVSQQALDQRIPSNYAQQYGPENPTYSDKAIQWALTHAPDLLMGRLAARRALAYHPLTKAQRMRGIFNPLNAAEQQGARTTYPPELISNVEELLGHPQLQQGGRTGKQLTPMGIQAITEGLEGGSLGSGFSSQARLGDLRRVLPGLGEGDLVNQRITPTQDLLLRLMGQGMEDSGFSQEAQQFQQGRAAAGRSLRTQDALKKIGKPVGKALSGGGILKTIMRLAKEA